MAKKTAQSPVPPKDASQPLVSTMLPVPPYIAADPELWFARLQLFFQHRGIQDEPTMFELGLGAIPEDSLSQLRDFILTAHTQTAPFTALKNVCLRRLADSEEQRIRQALLGEELSDRTPSAFLRRLEQLLPSSQRERENPILRQLFLSRLPPQLQAAMVPLGDKQLNELANIADQLMALQPCGTPGIAHGVQNVSHRLDRLERALEQLTLAVENGRRSPRSPSPSRRYQQRRSPSPMAGRRDPPGLCFYHRRFGQDARKSKEQSRCLFLTDQQTGTRFLIDTGATVSLLPLKFASAKYLEPHDVLPTLQAINGTPVTVSGSKTLTIHLDDLTPIKWTFTIADVNTAIIGADLIYHHRLAVDIGNRRLSSSTSQNPVAGMSPQPNEFSRLIQRFVDAQEHYDPKTTEERSRLEHFQHVIETSGPPVSSKARRLAPQRLGIAKQHFEELLRQGIVRPSNSNWSSPLHLVPKQEPGQWRPCGDFRNLNRSTKPDRYPLPHVADFNNELRGKTVFSKIDLASAYFQIPVRSQDVPKTAIITPFGLYEFTMMPFGLRNAYHPQANGMVERFHRQLKAALIARMQAAGIKWTTALPLVLLGIRTALKADIGLAPAEMVYGSSLRLPAEFLSPACPSTSADPSSFTSTLKAAMHRLQPTPPRRNSTATFCSKSLKDCTHVFIEEPGRTSSLTPPYAGPYGVLSRTSKTITVDLGGNHTTIAIDRTKPAFLMNEPQVASAMPYRRVSFQWPPARCSLI
uniref:Peptidase A2 domain-containing protein n=1 Tax=Trichuris muris TaxID=70415 RepID=A0A5S6QAV6_TRIMR